MRMPSFRQLLNFGRPARAAAPRRGGGAAFALGYEPVSAKHGQMRREAVVETKGEDWQLPAAKRLRLTNLLRDMLRNSPAFLMQNRQMCVNVVGSEGGKLHAAFPAAYKGAADEVMRYFNHAWAPHAEFTFRKGFNWLLKAALTAKDICGNVILVFDDGMLSGGDGTGRIRAFEGDEIADVADFARFWPKGFTQSQGFVYNRLGMFCGAVDSSCSHFDIPDFAISPAEVAEILMEAFTLSGDGCELTKCSIDIECTVNVHTVNGAIVASDVHSGRARVSATIGQYGEVEPSVTASDGWDVSAPLTCSDQDSDLPEWTVTLSKPLAKSSVS